MSPYLLGLRLSGRRVLVVGGGRVAQRRVPALLDAGALVTIVSTSVTHALDDLIATGRVTWETRRYQAGDVDGAWLVQACTDDHEVNAAVAEEAEAKRIWCVRADDKDASAAWTPPAARWTRSVWPSPPEAIPGAPPGSGTPSWEPSGTVRSTPGAIAPSPWASPWSAADPATPA